MNSFSLDESSLALTLISVAAEVGGVDRFGVPGRESGVVVPEGVADKGAAVAMLAVCPSSLPVLWQAPGQEGAEDDGRSHKWCLGSRCADTKSYKQQFASRCSSYKNLAADL